MVKNPELLRELKECLETFRKILKNLEGVNVPYNIIKRIAQIDNQEAMNYVIEELSKDYPYEED